MTTVLGSKTGNILLASYKTGNPFEIYAGTVIIAHSGVAIYGNASQVFTLSNAGSVYGYDDGIALNLGGTITNTGTIASDYTALNIAGGAGYVVNSGSLTGRSGVAVAMTDGGTLINKLGGVITGATLGSSGSDAVFITGATGTVVNDGAITQSAKAGQIRNGVLLNAGGAVTNHATGTITAGTFGVEARNAVGTVVNSGSIGGGLVGIGLYDGGGVTNLSGAITGAAGVYVTGAAGTIVNGATIAGSGGAGVYLKAGGRVSNLGTGVKISGAGDGVQIAGGSGTVQNSGSITGSLGGVVLAGGGYVNNVGAASKLSGGAVGVGVRGGAGTVSNAATITATGTAGVGVEFYDSAGVFANTVVNSGTIAGGSSGEAVLFGAGDDRLVIDPGAVFTGSVDGGGGTNTLEFAKTAFSGSFVGLDQPGFANFQRFNVDTGANWTFTGSSVLLPGASLTNRGDLTLGGTSVFNGATTNYGSIGGTMTIIGLGTAGPLVNEAGATIACAAEAIYGSFKAWSLTNAGTIISGGSTAIDLATAGAVITNQGAGLISGSPTAYYYNSGGVFLAAGGTVLNQDTTSRITGYNGVVSFGHPASVTNFGTISGAYHGVEIDSSTDASAPCEVANLGASATISGIIGVIVTSAAATVTNSGTVIGSHGSVLVQGFGVALSQGGALANQKGGLITGDYTGVGFGGYAGTLTNAGTIRGGSMTGVGAAVYITADNQADGFISGGVNGISLGAGGLITNEAGGVISGGTYGVLAQGSTAATVDNFGTIEATGASIGFNSAADKLIVEAGSKFIGSVVAGGGTLELAGGTGTLTGLGGTGALSGASAMTFSGFGAYVVDPGAALILAGTEALAGGKSVTSRGSLTVNGTLTDHGQLTISVGGVLTIADASTLEAQGVIANAGAIDLASTTDRTELQVLAAGATLSGGGTVTLSGPKSRIWGTATTAVLTNVDNTIAGSGWLGLSEMTLVNQAKGVIEATGKQGLVVNTKGVTSTNAGIIESASGSILTVQNSTLTQTGGGTIAALTGGRTLLSDDVIIGGTLSQAGTGVFNVNTSGGELRAVTINGLVRVLGAVALTLDGTMTNAGKLNTYGGSKVAELIVGPDGVTLSGGGQVNLSASANNLIVGAANTDVLTNVDNRIAGAGDIGDGAMVLINKGQIIGNTAVALTLDTGAVSITNSGTISAVSTGTVIVKSAVNNTGLLFAAAGTLTLDGAVTGAGTGQIKKGVLSIAASFGETVTFVTGATGQLRLTDWKDFTGSVKGLSLTGTNTIDLAGFTKTGATASYSGTTASGVLTVTNGTQTAKITLLGNYTGSTFTLASDGHGGVLVKDPPPAGAAPLIAGMAGFGASQGAGAAPAQIPPLQHWALARPV